MPILLWLVLIAYGFSAFLSCALAFIALSFGFEKPLNLTFAGFTLTLGLWVLVALILRAALWYEIGDSRLLYLAAIPFYLVGPALLAFTARYLNLPARIPDCLAIIATLILVLSIPALFQGRLFDNPSIVRPSGALQFDISPWGMVVGFIPILLLISSCWLFVQHRRKTREPFMGLSIFMLLLGVLLEMMIGQALPITPFTTIMSIAMLGYSVTNQQLFNPLHERTAALHREIRERERIEKALRESEEKFRNIVESSPMGMHMYELQSDNRLVFIGANPAADLILGVKNEQFIGKTIEEAFPALVNTEVPERYRRACTAGESWHAEQIDYADDQIRGAFEVQAFPYAPGKMTAFFVDITTRKQAELVLQQGQAAEKLFAERLAGLLRTLNELSKAESTDQLSRQAVELGRNLLQVDRIGLWLASVDRKHLLGMFGTDENGDLIDERGWTHPVDDFPEDKAIFSSVAPHYFITYGPLYRAEGEIGKEGPHAIAPIWNGQEVIGLLSVDNVNSQRPLTLHDGELLELYATSLGHLYSLKSAQEDIRKLSDELEQRVEQRTAELQAKNRELETFTYSVSHDLKAPLRGIDGYSHLLEEEYGDVLGEEGKRYSSNIRSGIQRMTQLIDDLLTYSRVERRAVVKNLVHLPSLVDAVMHEFRQQITQREVKITLNLSAGQVSAEVEGIAQALRNLVDNALKFTNDDKKPEIEIGSRYEGDYCLIWVKDNGVGFDMRYHDRIFQIFQRLHLPEEYPGTGIGLAMVRRVVERNGGRAWAESAPGEGATFYMELPS